MIHENCYEKLLECLAWLRENKSNREVAVVITDLEKLIAYYKVYVLGE